MKLALITDPKGFKVLKTTGMAYHMVLAAEVLKDFKYGQFYRDEAQDGAFILMDNGAAEHGTLPIKELLMAADVVHADEIILPDTMCDVIASMRQTMDKKVLDAISPIKRAVVPQGNTVEEWWACALFYTQNLEFATLCIPKHAERWPGGRAAILQNIVEVGWHNKYNIHLLGIWGDPWLEMKSFEPYLDIVRGIDTAAPFAWAQHDHVISHPSEVYHISHTWGRRFNPTKALGNIDTLKALAWRVPDADN